MPVTVEALDVEAVLLRPLTPIENRYIGDLCDQAIAKLKTALPSVTDRVTAYEADPKAPGAIDPSVVRSMLAGVIKRVLVNPRGLWSDMSATGPYSRSQTYPGARSGGGSADAPGALAILPSDLSQLSAGSVIMASTLRIKGWRPGGPDRRC